jgi:hypothetical protein
MMFIGASHLGDSRCRIRHGRHVPAGTVQPMAATIEHRSPDGRYDAAGVSLAIRRAQDQRPL